MRREWLWHRQAYAPRLWPSALFTGLTSALVSLFVDAGLVLTLMYCFAIGTGFAWLRMWVWRRQHPILPARELLRRQQETAPWN